MIKATEVLIIVLLAFVLFVFTFDSKKKKMAKRQTTTFNSQLIMKD